MLENSSFLTPARPSARLTHLRLLLLCGMLLGLGSARAQNVVVFTNLVSFNKTNGYLPTAPLLQAKDGNFYGTTPSGGAHYSGTIFQLTTNNVLNTLISLDFTNGATPTSGLIQGLDGNFYGTASSGGTNAGLDSMGYGFGTIFQLTTNGAFNVLATFAGTNGSYPNGLLQTSNGVFYGTTYYGEATQSPLSYNNGNGSLFTLDTNHNLSNLFFFSGANGEYPFSPLVQSSNGNFYGSTIYGGATIQGTVFEYAANGNFTSLDSFGGTNSYSPNGLIPGKDGNFYGTAQGSTLDYGTVFQLTPGGALKILASFNTNTGFAPQCLMQAKDGNFYGTTSQGGTYNNGAIFELNTNGVLLPLYSFTGTNDGYYATSLMQATDGSFYGTTKYGGSFNYGTIFKMSLVPSPNIQHVGATNGVITLTWPAAMGQNYQVQYLTNLTQTNWSTLTNFTAAGATGTATDSTKSGTQRFYRVVLVL